ncbi:hypothetical protein [Lewinella sp. JB7]|uniref:hypothetical protein n=1 Tax=Lewinella sp. JB7 TaxID=2962887 RepID=UPI0020C9DA70|nr:hypothetical protein [Lewinella sp. JB7]MCP9235698.1 hypothetical protein [Lewinella sp. JB7]
MQTPRLQTLIGLLLITMFTAGCSKDDCTDVTNPDCPNYDYCVALGKLSADFETYIHSSTAPFSDGKFYYLSTKVRDTTFGGSLQFRGLDDTGNTYAWNFGDDQRTRYGKETSYDFYRHEQSGPTMVELSVYREDDQCPERGAELAIRTESLYIIGEDADFDTRPILGTFVGNNEDESVQSDFPITFFYTSEIDEVRLKGFPRGAVNGEVLNNLGINLNYKEFLIMPTANACCSRVHGVGELSDDKQRLRIEYKIYDFDRERWIEKVWTGKRKRG